MCSTEVRSQRDLTIQWSGRPCVDLTVSNHGLGRAPLSALPFSRGEEITSQQLVSVAEPHFLALPLHAVIRVTGTALHAEKQGRPHV